MTIDALVNLLNAIGRPYAIKTNIAYGRGINGVSYINYHCKRRYSDTNEKVFVSLKVEHGMLCVSYIDYDYRGKSLGEFVDYIPLSNIVTITKRP